MRKSDLKPGYVVMTRDGHLRMLVPLDDRLVFARDCGLYVSYEGFNDNLEYTGVVKRDFDIMAVYGHATCIYDVHSVSTDSRKLLWERAEPKKMTVAEICKELGYDVEIVKDGGSDA